MLYICAIVMNVCLYVICLIGSWVHADDAIWGCGPCILLFATSNGMLKQEAVQPATKPIANWNGFIG